MEFFFPISISGCLQLLVELLMEMLEMSWNFVDAAGKFYNEQCNFRSSGDF